MSTQTGSDSEINEPILTDLEYRYDESEDYPLLNKSDRKYEQSVEVRRRIEYRLEQMKLRQQIDSWGEDDLADGDLEH
ncbi:MAG: hypothetical protein KUG82_00115 [Pseudomonadales bacterium]|nr:hypothetical protein [Pseudomonadales bacterium]